MQHRDADGHGHGPSTLGRLAMAAAPLGSVAGVRLRLHWTFALVPGVVLLEAARHGDLGPAATWAIVATLALLAVAATHEIAHALAARAARVPVPAVVVHPLSPLAHREHPAPSPRAEMALALAGPLTHAVWFVVVGAPYFLVVPGSAAEGTPWAAAALAFVWANAALLFLHAAPFWPTDGGRVLRAALAMRMHANHASLVTSYVGFAGALVVALAGGALVVQAPPDAAWAAVAGPALVALGLWQGWGSRRLLLDARWGEGPYARSEPWTRALPQATWSLEDPTPAEPVAVEERRERRAAVEAPPRRREAARPAARPLHERIDELLDRINEVGGVEHLSEAERRELSDASEQLRRGDG